MLDLDFVRQQFPAFAHPDLAGWAHFENAGGSYACGAVIDQLHHYYTATKVQPYAWSAASIEAGRRMDSARERMAAALGVSTEEVSFGPSTTQNTYVLAQAFRALLEPGDEVVVTNLDHEANVGAWRRLADDGVVVREWGVDEDGHLDGEALDELLGPRTRVVAFTHCSNIVARINPVQDWVDRIHAAGAVAVVDGVSYCGHGLPDVGALGADVYLFSLYKVYGPHQGVMVLRRDLNERLPNQAHYFNAGKPVARQTPAGPDHAQIAASNGVLDYFDAIHDHHLGAGGEPRERARAVADLFQQREHALVQPLLDFLADHDRVRLIGSADARTRAPTVALTAEGIQPADLAARLADARIGVSAGHFYAPRCLEALGIAPEAGVLRISLVHYNGEDEVQRTIEVLRQAL